MVAARGSITHKPHALHLPSPAPPLFQVISSPLLFLFLAPSLPVFFPRPALYLKDPTNILRSKPLRTTPFCNARVTSKSPPKLPIHSIHYFFEPDTTVYVENPPFSSSHDCHTGTPTPRSSQTGPGCGCTRRSVDRKRYSKSSSSDLLHPVCQK